MFYMPDEREKFSLDNIWWALVILGGPVFDEYINWAVYMLLWIRWEFDTWKTFAQKITLEWGIESWVFNEDLPLVISRVETFSDVAWRWPLFLKRHAANHLKRLCFWSKMEEETLRKGNAICFMRFAKHWNKWER